MNTEPAFITFSASFSAFPVLIIRCSGAYLLLNSMHSSMPGSTIATLSSRDCDAISRLGRVLSCILSSSMTDVNRSLLSVSNTTWLSVPCSACDKRSAATNTGSAFESAITRTSLGPAGMSIATPSELTISFALVTYWLPGPNILSTFGILSVPYAIAAIACAPPVL